ncbi:hypothetical protein QBC34DRAFT_453813 [Podospora aff. communis PSN243]|uniref:DUF1749-domain-containing protein n=1 Tax=Podospora aff. communis PSN243 TaxID=3040156 RepID=A0AAV9H927_9PEZI|nr:hypothetical protein QBC34DRAFT_453813 [Podospora aff. communis PSN243]
MSPFPVIVHQYPSSAKPDRPRSAFEYRPSPSETTTTTRPQNALVFIPGLGDSPFDVPYIQTIASKLTSSSYSAFEINLYSSGSAFGYGSIAQDVRDIADLVRYLKGSGRKKVVLMGHSTGCQDCMGYAKAVAAGKVPGVEGYVLQGPVSDREAIGLSCVGEGVRESLGVAERMVREGRGEEVMERDVLPGEWRESPVSAYRWASLAGVGGDDDCFSSDLGNEKLKGIWGNVQSPVLIVPSGADEFVPAEVDVPGMVERWRGFCRPRIMSGLSGLIPGANHRVDDATAKEWLADRVSRFLGELGE